MNQFNLKDGTRYLLNPGNYNSKFWTSVYFLHRWKPAKFVFHLKSLSFSNTAGNGGSSFIGLKIYVYNAQRTIETLNKRGGKERVGE